jgi:hypothetical protein
MRPILEKSSMSRVDWYVEGPSYGSCNCSYGCPCQFEALPTHGHCTGFEVLRIDKGHFGEVRLEGIQAALIYAWPGPVFEGKGVMQVIIDERANPGQREALTKIFHGEETDDAATHWWVFRKMSDTVHPTLFKPIAYEVDVEARTARVSIPGVVESTGTPIRSPVNGKPHRVRINIPDGIEFEMAEIGSATTRATGAIKLDLKDTYGQFNHLRHSGKGVVHG